MTTETAKAAEAVREYARQTISSKHFHRHPFGPLIFTDGIKFLAETCGAFWLIDVVASHQLAIRRVLAKHSLRDFQVWRLILNRAVSGGAEVWEVDAWSDTPESYAGPEPASVKLAQQTIGYFNFPEELCHVGVIDPATAGFQFWVEHGTMMLKEER